MLPKSEDLVVFVAIYPAPTAESDHCSRGWITVEEMFIIQGKGGMGRTS